MATANLRQTMRAQVDQLVDRLPTVQAMADGRPDTRGDSHGGDAELAAPYSDPTAAAVVAQMSARRVVADFETARRALAAASAGARMLVPAVIRCCAGCGEPAGTRKTVTFKGDLYHLTPCEMRARRSAQAKAG